MGEKLEKMISSNKKKQKHKQPNEDQDHSNPQTSKKHLDNNKISFRPSAEVKGLRFGGQFVVKSFTIRRARPIELLQLLSLPLNNPTSNSKNKKLPFPSTTAFIPTNFTILALHAWHTLTLGLGTKKSKVVIFVFEHESMKAAFDSVWPLEILLGELNKKMIRGLKGFEMARFKFRKGCITFYVYAVRKLCCSGFSCAGDLRTVLQCVVDLNDFLDHTAMLALSNQRNITHAPPSCNASSLG